MDNREIAKMFISKHKNNNLEQWGLMVNGDTLSGVYQKLISGTYGEVVSEDGLNSIEISRLESASGQTEVFVWDD